MALFRRETLRSIYHGLPAPPLTSSSGRTLSPITRQALVEGVRMSLMLVLGHRPRTRLAPPAPFVHRSSMPRAGTL